MLKTLQTKILSAPSPCHPFLSHPFPSVNSNQTSVVVEKTCLATSWLPAGKMPSFCETKNLRKITVFEPLLKMLLKAIQIQSFADSLNLPKCDGFSPSLQVSHVFHHPAKPGPLGCPNFQPKADGFVTWQSPGQSPIHPPWDRILLLSIPLKCLYQIRKIHQRLPVLYSFITNTILV